MRVVVAIIEESGPDYGAAPALVLAALVAAGTALGFVLDRLARRRRAQPITSETNTSN